MPLESCMILLDNSEYMRNGDYVPTRMDAQKDAANLLIGAKWNSHPENTIGVGAGPELLVSPTRELADVLKEVHDLSLKSVQSDVTAAVQVASLALKHRINKNGGQRIVLFVGTPLEGIEPRALAKAGRQLKKNNVAIDVVAMGEIEANEAKLRELVDAANGRSEEGAERTCHLVTIPAGVLPSDVLASSPVIHGSGGGSAFAASAAAAAATGGGGGGGGDAFAEFGGVDPNMDPELAMALRISMEEERARQERVAAAQQQQESDNQESGGAEPAPAAGDTEMAEASGSAAAVDGAAMAMDMGLSEEEALLQQALAMSMNENEPKSNDDEKPAAASQPSGSAAMMEEDDEEAAMQMALQMSMQQDSEATKETPKEDGEGQQFQDPQFVSELLGSLGPGVDPNDPAIQAALRNLEQGGDKKDEKKKTDEKSNDKE